MEAAGCVRAAAEPDMQLVGLEQQGTGADVMKRIAAPMIGGLFTSFLLELTVYPAIFALWKGRGLSPSAGAAP